MIGIAFCRYNSNDKSRDKEARSDCCPANSAKGELDPNFDLITGDEKHCHVNRWRAQESESAANQTIAAAVFHTLNASVRNRLNVGLLSKWRWI